jgi:Protein of unknown function (DUF2442)
MSMGADLIEVTDVKVLGHYRLRLTFSDGYIGDVDVSDIRDKGNLFADLHDPRYFARVRVDPDVGTIAWPNGLDLAPERLYREATPPSSRAQQPGEGHTAIIVAVFAAMAAGAAAGLRAILRELNRTSQQ